MDLMEIKGHKVVIFDDLFQEMIDNPASMKVK
jgi:hypothetical protein